MKKTKSGKRSPTARVLESKLFRHRVKQSKKIYSRKKKSPDTVGAVSLLLLFA